MTNFKYSNSVLINLLIVSIITFLIWGPFFPDLIVSISTLFFLFYTFKNKEFKDGSPSSGMILPAKSPFKKQEKDL